MARADRLDYVPLEPLQRRFADLVAADAISATEVARRLGWLRNAPPSQRSRSERVPDTGRASRLLRTDRCITQRRVKYETAADLAEVLGLDPFEAGV